MKKRPTNQSQPSAHEPRKSSPAKINPRERRLFERLLNGPALREALDRVSGSSNVPDVIFRIRRKYDLEIPCERVAATDRDGQPCRPGRYYLTEDDRIIVAVVLQEAA